MTIKKTPIIQQPSKPCMEQGFTLIEIAIVLAIIGLILMGSLQAFSQGQRAIQKSQWHTQAEAIRLGLTGFLLSHGHLPCPDSDFDGSENRQGVLCTHNQGRLPYLDIGAGQQDPWGNPYWYQISPSANQPRVHSDCVSQSNPMLSNTCGVDDFVLPYTGSYFADHTSPLNHQPFASFNGQTQIAGNGNHPPHTQSDLHVMDGNGHLTARDTPIVIVSFGKNGRQLWQLATHTLRCPQHLSRDEQENCDGDNTFVQKGDIRQTDHWFDDHIFWVSGNTLKANALKAGLIP